MGEEHDTETLVALVSSLLDQETDSESILEALIRSNGDPSRAAQLINDQSQAEPSSSAVGQAQEKNKKRKHGLDSWLKGSKAQKTTNSVMKGEPGDMSSKPPSRGSSSSSPKKQTVNLMSVLQQPSTGKKAAPRKPPLLLSTPEMVTQHTPCTLHHSVLPPELACELFYTLEESSRTWRRNKWWLFDRMVESPHRTSFFVRRTDGITEDESWHQAAPSWYNGQKTEPPLIFPPAMETACCIIERVVSDEIRKRTRFPLEWAGHMGPNSDLLWRANVAASNRYEGRKESVGWHSDQLTYLGPYCTIASLSLGTRRPFSLREVVPSQEADTRRPQTFNIPLAHNSLVIMHASCQERFKHCIPPQSAMDLYRPSYPRSPNDPIEPSNCRINITFRFYRPDFRPSSVPLCKCGVSTALRPDMKNRSDGKEDKYWWTCFAGAQNDGKSCNLWQVLDMEAEGRGPIVGQTEAGLELKRD